MATLIVTAGPNQGATFALGAGTIVVGRGEAAAFQLADERVSGKHIQVRYDEASKSYRLLDLRSTNGTFLQSRKLEGEHKLEDNDEINIGNSRLMFSLKDFPDKASAEIHVNQVGQKMRTVVQQR